MRIPDDKGIGHSGRAEKQAHRKQAHIREASTYLTEVSAGILANASASLMLALTLIWLEAKLWAQRKKEQNV